MQETSTKPYLLRALYEWCTDNGYTPYLAVYVDRRTNVPQEHVRDDEIVLNVGFDATSGLEIGNDWICFKARFGGKSRTIEVPVDNVMAIYARENGQGMSFPVDREALAARNGDSSQAGAGEGPRIAPVSQVPSVDRTSDQTHSDGGDDGEGPRLPPDGGSPTVARKRAALKIVK